MTEIVPSDEFETGSQYLDRAVGELFASGDSRSRWGKPLEWLRAEGAALSIAIRAEQVDAERGLK